MSAAPAQVLMVCTGNICRSPMMERLFRQSLERHGAAADVVVGSAGTWAQAGEPMQPFAVEALTQHGVDAAGFTATSLTEELVRSSDLVLTATRDHRASVVGMVPGSVRRTFTLLEMSRIAADAPPNPHAESRAVPDMVRRAVAWAAQMRGSVPRPEAGADDLVDPLGAPAGVYRERADTITSAVGQIVPFLIGGQATHLAD